MIPRQELTLEQVTAFGGPVFSQLEAGQVTLGHTDGNFDNDSDTLIRFKEDNLRQITAAQLLEALDSHPEISMQTSSPPITVTGVVPASRGREIRNGQGGQGKY